MINEFDFGDHVTQAYVNLVKNEVLLKYPNFYFDRGSIIYDYDNEVYLFVGYSEVEELILRETVLELDIN